MGRSEQLCCEWLLYGNGAAFDLADFVLGKHENFICIDCTPIHRFVRINLNRARDFTKLTNICSDDSTQQRI